jgi:hypothetical protein
MDETPSDSGESPVSVPLSDRVREQLKRPAVWSLIVVVVVVLALQIWLLFL